MRRGKRPNQLPASCCFTRPAAWQAKQHDAGSWFGRFPRLMLGGLGGLTLLGLFVSPLPKFDYNLLHLQAKGTESVAWENRLLEESDRSSWYALSTADSLAELQRKKAQFAALPVVDRVESLASMLPPNQEERLALLAEIAPVVESVSATWENVEPIDVEELSTTLEKIRFKLQQPPSDWDPTKRPSEESLTAARTALIAVQERLKTMPPATANQALDAFQRG